MSFLLLSSADTAQGEASLADIVTKYLIYGAIILVGLIIIFIINRCSRPLTPAKLKEKCAATKKSVVAIRDGVSNGKHSKAARKRIKIYSEINGMIYASTRIIDEERDVTLEDVRTSLQKALAIIDGEAAPYFDHADSAALYSAVLTELEKAEGALDKIAERRKKFGR